MGSLLEITPLTRGGGMRLSGELDLSTAPELSDALAASTFESEVVLDVRELTFIDSSGLNVLVTFAASLNGNGPLVLLDLPDSVERVFEIAGLDEHPGIELRHSDSGS